MNPDERIEKALEGQLSEIEWQQFQQDVVNDPELREAYVRSAYLHGQLLAERDSLPELLNLELESEKKSVVVWRTLGWSLVAASIAFVLTLWLSPSEEDLTVATIVSAEDCRWAGSELPTVEGARLGTGTLALVEGVATLQFNSGAELTIEAPTTLEVLDEMRCRLIEGSLVADVPPSAHGFTIDTQDMEVIDLGTRFGLTASGLGDTHVFVFEGEVEIDGVDTEPKRLTTGQALRQGDRVPTATQEVERRNVAPSLEGGWLSIPTSFGEGKDAYVRQGNGSGLTGNHPLLMVKHTDIVPTNIRYSLLSFDLSEADLFAVEDSELVLQVRSSGLGFSSLVPDSEFAVYGLATDEWDEGSLQWESVPDWSDATRLASFSIPKGSPMSQVTARSTALTDFIRGAGDGLATFVIVRETGELEKQGLVHAFASKEHPSAQAPTLRLKTTDTL